MATLSEIDPAPGQALCTHSSRRWKCLEKTFVCFNRAEIFTKHGFRLVAQRL